MASSPGRLPQLRTRPLSLNLDSTPTSRPPSRSVSFNGGSGTSVSSSMVSLYWRHHYQQRQQRRLMTPTRCSAVEAGLPQRRPPSSTSSTNRNSCVIMTKLLNEGMHWNGTIYRNNGNRWKNSWTLLDNPILGVAAVSEAPVDDDDEGFYGSGCLGEHRTVTDVNDNDMITSFSNPNYGLDAFNSNSITSLLQYEQQHQKVPISDRLSATNLHVGVKDDVIDNRCSNHGNRQITFIDNDSHFTIESDQVDASSVSGCSTDSDEDSAVDIPALPLPTYRRAIGRTGAFLTTTASCSTLGTSSSGRQQSVQVHQVRAAANDASLPLKTSPSGNVALSSDGSGGSRPSSSNTIDKNIKEASFSSAVRDVYSPDSNDSGIDVRGRSCRRSSRGRCDVTTGSESTTQAAGEADRRQRSDGLSAGFNCASDTSNQALPTGWEKHTDEDGAYYWHIKSGTIQRELPANNPNGRPSVSDSEADSLSSSDLPGRFRPVDQSSAAINCMRLEQQHSVGSDGSQRSVDVGCSSSTGADSWSSQQPESVEYQGFPIRFAVHSLGWIQMSDEDLTPERSSRAVNRCIVKLSVGRDDVMNDAVGRWGDGKSLYLELDEENVTLLDPQDLSILNVQPIQSIRIWGVGRNNGRDFAYVARDCATRKHMCHVFRCDGLARHIANALRDVCKRILANRAALRREGERTTEVNVEADTQPDDNPDVGGACGGAAMTSSTNVCRPTDLPNLRTRRGPAEVNGQLNNGEHLTFESIYRNTSFPTPMEEPRKIVRCHYLGTTLVHRPTGVDVLNNAMDNVYTRALPEKWVYVNVSVAPSTISIIEHGKPDNVFAECRVRFLSFMGIAMNNVRLCAFIMHCAQDQFLAHVFHCDPSAGALCKTIEAACKSIGTSLRQGVQTMFGNLTKGCKP